MNVWRIIVVAAFGGLLLLAAAHQKSQNGLLNKQTRLIVPQYEEARKNREQLTQLKKQLSEIEAEAELFGYLQHPWPVTQVLAAVVEPLPEAITLNDIQIIRQAIAAASEVRTNSRKISKPIAEDPEKVQPAVRDLQQLRARADKSVRVVMLTGTTTNTADLHQYLARLSQHWIFVKVDLESVESSESAPPGSESGAVRPAQFRARISIRQGYGQPHGPKRYDEIANRLHG